MNQHAVDFLSAVGTSVWLNDQPYELVSARLPATGAWVELVIEGIHVIPEVHTHKLGYAAVLQLPAEVWATEYLSRPSVPPGVPRAAGSTRLLATTTLWCKFRDDAEVMAGVSVLTGTSISGRCSVCGGMPGAHLGYCPYRTL